MALIFVCTLGGLLVYQQSSFGKLKNMSSLDMIEYCCSDKNTKISVAFIENGEITYHIYSQNGEETNIYDYEIGSISKTFVGALCAKAINENQNASDTNRSKQRYIRLIYRVKKCSYPLDLYTVQKINMCITLKGIFQ